jgi:cytochrome b
MTDTIGGHAKSGNEGDKTMVRVWDPLIRIFHWSLVVFFAIAWLTADELQPVHEIAGYAVAGLIAFRLAWGVIGSRYARFAQFMRGPAATFSYLGDMARGREHRYLGHNPAGAAMIVALLVTLSGTAFTGWLMEEPGRAVALSDLPQIVASAFADEESYEAGYSERQPEGSLKEIHETLANVLLVLVALHIGGVVLASFRHHENLARAMVTGTKRSAGPEDIS